ncbi:MAG: hypothetical protein ACK55Z_03355 [bacterium]
MSTGITHLRRHTSGRAVESEKNCAISIRNQQAYRDKGMILCSLHCSLLDSFFVCNLIATQTHCVKRQRYTSKRIACR